MFRVSCVGERTRGVDSSVVVRLRIDFNFVTSYYIYALILSPCVREEGRSIKTLNTPMTQTQTLIEVRVLQIVRTVKPIWSRSGNAGLWSSRGSEREQEIQQINAEADEARRQLEARERLLQEQNRIRMARREFMEKWRAQKAAEGKGNSDDQQPPPGNSSA